MEIPLTKGYMATIDEEDAERIRDHSWHVSVQAGGPKVMARVAGKMTYLHRFLMDATPGTEIDHVDGNPLNNRRRNLRFATRSQNLANTRRERALLGLKGVTFYASRRDRQWRARISIRDKSTHLGYFNTKEEAARAYDEAARAIHGEFALTNDNAWLDGAEPNGRHGGKEVMNDEDPTDRRAAVGGNGPGNVRRACGAGLQVLEVGERA